MKKHRYLVLMIYFTLLLTACEKKSDLTPLVSRFESQSSEFEKITQEVLEHPEVNSIYFDKSENDLSIRYQNDDAKTVAYKYPITIQALEILGLSSVDVIHVLSTDARLVETKTIEGIKISGANEFRVTDGFRAFFKPIRGTHAGWVFLPTEPEPNLLMSSSMCYESLLDNYVDVNQFPDQNVQIEIYLPTKISNWYVYCWIEQPNPN